MVGPSYNNYKHLSTCAHKFYYYFTVFCSLFISSSGIYNITNTPTKMLRNNSQTLGTLWLFCDPDLQNRPAQKKKPRNTITTTFLTTKKKKKRPFRRKSTSTVSTQGLCTCVCVDLNQNSREFNNKQFRESQ